MREQRLRALAVRLPAVDAAAARHADDHRRGEVAGRAVAQPRGLGDDLVRRRVEVVGELDLHHRPQAVGGHADRGADDAAFGDRRIEHAVLAVFGLQAFGAAEHAAEVAHVLAEDDDVRRRARASRPSRNVAPGSWSSWPWSATLCSAACRICSCRCGGMRSNTSSNMVASGGMWPSCSEPCFEASFSAAAISSSSAFCVCACSSSDQAPRPIRCCFSRATGSPSGKVRPVVGRPVARRGRRRWNARRRGR